MSSVLFSYPQALKERELRAAPERIEKATELVQQQRERETALQERYKLATREYQDLCSSVGSV